MSKAKKAVKADSLLPHKISETVWFYTARGGLDFVVESRSPSGVLVTCEQFRLTWRRIDKALKQRRVTAGKP